MCCKPIRTKNDKCEDEVENVFKTYREVIDKMGKVSLNQKKQRPRGTYVFSRWEVEQKHEKSDCFGRCVVQIEKFHYRCASFFQPDRST